MAALPKPTDDTQWGGTCVEPSTPQKTTGWTASYKPPAQWVNWWQRAVGRWVYWLSSLFLPKFMLTNWVSTSLAASLGAGNNLTGIATNGSIFVTVGQGGKISSSADGITWTAQSSGTSNAITGLVYLNSHFVVFESGDGHICHSTDGATWTRVDTTIGTGVLGMIYGASKYIVYTAATDTVAASSALTSWTTSTPFGGGGSVDFMATDGTNIVAGTSANSTTVRYSTNGTSWSNGTHGLGSHGVTALVNGGGKFVITVNSGVSIAYSTAGATWTVVSVLGSLAVALAYDSTNSRWILTDGGNLDTSADAITWYASASPGITITGFFRSTNGFIVAVGGIVYMLVSTYGISFSRTLLPAALAPSVGFADFSGTVVGLQSTSVLTARGAG